MSEAVGRQELALDAAADAGVDLLLAGHNHRASTHSARDLVTRAGSALVVQAGTATSTRVRDEAQSFNRIGIAPEAITVTVEGWDGTAFVPATAQSYVRSDDRWHLAGAERELEETAR
jgi:3',5'-cyclic AMP phosphodiesterase CpdA